MKNNGPGRVKYLTSSTCGKISGMDATNWSIICRECYVLDSLCKYETEVNCFMEHCNGNCNVLGLYTHLGGNVRKGDEKKISLYSIPSNEF